MAVKIKVLIESRKQKGDFFINFIKNITFLVNYA